MTDIVERLQMWAGSFAFPPKEPVAETLLHEAAAEIERLRKALAWYADFEHWRGHGMQDAETIHDCGEIARRTLGRKP